MLTTEGFFGPTTSNATLWPEAALWPEATLWHESTLWAESAVWSDEPGDWVSGLGSNFVVVPDP